MTGPLRTYTCICMLLVNLNLKVRSCISRYSSRWLRWSLRGLWWVGVQQTARDESEFHLCSACKYVYCERACHSIDYAVAFQCIIYPLYYSPNRSTDQLMLTKTFACGRKLLHQCSLTDYSDSCPLPGDASSQTIERAYAPVPKNHYMINSLRCSLSPGKPSVTV